MACMMASFSEGLTLADRSGLSKDDLIKILSLGAMANPMFNIKGPKIVADGARAWRGFGCLWFSATMARFLPPVLPCPRPPPPPTHLHGRPHAQLPSQARAKGPGLQPRPRQPARRRGQDGGGRQRCVLRVGRILNLLVPLTFKNRNPHHNTHTPRQNFTRHRYPRGTGSWTSRAWRARWRLLPNRRNKLAGRRKGLDLEIYVGAAVGSHE